MAIAVGCQSATPQSAPGVRTHTDGKGPLSAHSSPGFKALYAPASAPWYSTFGSLLLCSMDPATDLVVRDVRAVTAPRPLALSTWIRTVPPLSGRAAGRPLQWAPIFGSVGRYAGRDTTRHRGHYSSAVTGARVDQDCADLTPESGFTELVFEVKAGQAGAMIRRTFIDYTANGKPLTLELRWGMVACGEELLDTTFCNVR